MLKQRLSIAMCTYNGAKFLPRQLDTIAGQTRQPDEMVVCDDGSSDGTVDILKEYANVVEFPLHIHRNPERLGWAKNFEQAISLCQGDVIVLSDQDDEWRAEKLSVFDRVLSEDPTSGYVFSDVTLIDEVGETICSSFWRSLRFYPLLRQMASLDIMKQLGALVKADPMAGNTLAFRANIVPLAFPVPRHWGHDSWITLTSTLAGRHGIPVDQTLGCYRQHRNQVTGGVRRDSMLTRTSHALTGKSELLVRVALEKWSIALTRINQMELPHRALVDLVDMKVSHLACRASLYNRSRTFRVPGIASEITGGRYHRFSNGWSSVLKDLLVPPLAQ
jgi:glycosyltransferase involved in cell wall biosynthesis